VRLRDAADGLTLLTTRSERGSYDAATATWDIGDLSARLSVELEHDVRLSTLGTPTNWAQTARLAAIPADDVHIDHAWRSSDGSYVPYGVGMSRLVRSGSL
jgi:hypothetical protein